MNWRSTGTGRAMNHNRRAPRRRAAHGIMAEAEHRAVAGLKPLDRGQGRVVDVRAGRREGTQLRRIFERRGHHGREQQGYDAYAAEGPFEDAERRAQQPFQHDISPQRSFYTEDSVSQSIWIDKLPIGGGGRKTPTWAPVRKNADR